ncbi:MAG: FHA domain-containing protein [Myxococcales bacterium]
MSTYLLSALARQYGGQPLSAFETAHPYSWLLWEPGAWTPPRKASDTMLLRPSTPLPGGAGEALALGLVSKRGSTQITLGRGPDNDLPINDATLSTTHLVLMADERGWTVRDANSRNGTWLDGAQLVAGIPQRLAEASSIRAAQVGLTFYTPKGLFERMRLSGAARVAAPTVRGA